MIGTPAGFEHALAALQAGVTTIGNLGQYNAFELPGGQDDIQVTEAAIRAIGLLAAYRERGALVHSYLEDGVAMQASHYGSYVGWAALEVYVVERLCGARLAHSYGGLIDVPCAPRRRPPGARRPPRPRLDRLDGLRQHGRHAAPRPRRTTWRC